VRLIQQTRDRGRLEAFLRRDAATQIYALADLDAFFWPETTWYAWVEGGDRIDAVCLVLERLSPPIVYAVCSPAHEPTGLLLDGVRELLPPRFFANLSSDLIERLRPHFAIVSESRFQKMFLPSKVSLPSESAEFEELAPADYDELRNFYVELDEEPGEDERVFETYMLEMGPYLGVRDCGKLIAAGGVHLVSRRYGVAALGNIATHPAWRRKGLARSITRALCARLRSEVELIGLNVMTSNTAAVRCYEDIGFRPLCSYIEGILEHR
jgi:predicted GNAT family acetyltransferase